MRLRVFCQRMFARCRFTTAMSSEAGQTVCRAVNSCTASSSHHVSGPSSASASAGFDYLYNLYSSGFRYVTDPDLCLGPQGQYLPYVCSSWPSTLAVLDRHEDSSRQGCSSQEDLHMRSLEWIRPNYIDECSLDSWSNVVPISSLNGFAASISHLCSTDTGQTLRGRTL